jgi:hypothetical protein
MLISYRHVSPIRSSAGHRCCASTYLVNLGISYPRADFRTCRLTGSAVFTGLGIYALREAHIQGAFRKVRMKGQPVVGGQITAVLGLGEWSLTCPVLVLGASGIGV